MPASTFVVTAPNWSLMVRSELPGDAIVSAVRDEIRKEEREAAVDRVRTVDAVISETVSAQRILAALVAAFAALALVLARLGGLVRLLAREGAALVVIGLATGLAAMIVLQPVLQRLIIDAGPLSVPLGGAVVAFLFLVGMIAVAFPAICAARIDPVRHLRAE